MPAPDPARLLALLYAGPGSAVCRLADGHLEVRPASRLEGTVVLTQDELLSGGDLGALFDLVA
ncbi:hypothetical protein [Nocardiopsis sp. FR26]|uniref:hypothetical protein n=1 Tax=Nocardiopsis sp. FR26 TaxID=2605987 RepID=UPI00135A9F1B|nr:hypothetical protein [Nocardiopsis sp. FR26]